MVKRTGLLFGSFNPVHIGHLAIANYIMEFARLEEVWFILSPANPLKDASNIADEAHRATMLQIALTGEPRFKYCDIELTMPRPSFTIDTLEKLAVIYPETNFTILIGADNLLSINKWKDYEKLLATREIIVYPRPGYPIDEPVDYPKVSTINAPLIEISATMLRSAITEGKHLPFLLPAGVFNYIKSHGLYKVK